MRAFLSYVYLILVAFTSRIRIHASQESARTIIREGRPVVFTYWYEYAFFLLHFFGQRNITILVTPKEKVDLLSSVAKLSGVSSVKGSFEGGGRHALVTLLDLVKSGNSVAVPASGPYSPDHKCKTGCFIIAQEANVPIVPLAWKARFKIQLRTKGWPILIPLPFNSIELRVGEPTLVNRHYEFTELEGAKVQLANQLDRLND